MNEEKETLLDRMILEGLAEHFVEKELGTDFLGPHKSVLTEKQAKFESNIEQINIYLENTPKVMNKIFGEYLKRFI
ncbi:DUF2268 domain-containing putative Zn-dependent protease [Bacillus salitolerans]|uniref:DUF2268 domain-containing putative Zn-dependent protease n=1 Tax=Bacillus salitolerans TaxID=1437434 RepID=A0ABW4LW12_9BACI